jgi:glycosyltransferase involved in cell wall biosynthesis
MSTMLPQIFAFASNEWHTPWWMARQHFFTRLSRRGWPVVYSTGPQSIWERHTDKWRRGGLVHRFDVIEPGQLLVDRPGKCFPLWKNEGRWRNFVIRRHARHLLKGLPSDPRRKKIAYLWNPRFWPYVEELGADYVVLHVHDAWDTRGWSAVQKSNMKQLAQRADLLITTADNMSRDLPGIGPGVARVLPHGVDFEAVAAGVSQPCPPDLAAIPHPRIGYTGRVNLKLNFPEIVKAATMRPDWHWVFVGATGIGTTYSFEGNASMQADWERLSRMPNVHFLGVKKRHEIPAYLNHFDVLSLPFSSSYVGFPTKLLEYFASGKPIISWDGENVRDLAPVLDIAPGAEGWVSAIEGLLRGEPEAKRQLRKDMAVAGDWNSRTDRLERWLMEMAQ